MQEVDPERGRDNSRQQSLGWRCTTGQHAKHAGTRGSPSPPEKF